MRLVDLLDDVLALAESDPRFCFTLDGQMAVVDDYLEIRPNNRERVRQLVRTGQLAVGPWQILLDEFLASGETIVRNIEMGLHRAEELGGVMPVGYLPDMFGHCAQMPQLLARAGFTHACVWRGVPQAIDRHAFRWYAPDGSCVRAEYLIGGYGNAADLFEVPGRTRDKAEEFCASWEPFFGDDEVLAMYGTDHSAPLPALMTVVDALEAGEASVRMHVTTLSSYLTRNDADTLDLPTHHGELRSHTRANILPGVISARVHLKRAMARAERVVERYAEPFVALWSPDWPQPFLDLAWRRLVESSCHDSVTGCGIDDTAIQVAARIAEAEQLGRGVRDRVAGQLARSVPVGAAVILNPTPRRRTGWIECDFAVPAEWDDVALETADGTLVATQTVGRDERLCSAGPDVRWRAPAEEPRRTLVAAVPVPPLGWTSVRPVAAAVRVEAPVRGRDGRELDNGRIRVKVREDGALRITAADGTVLDGVGRLVDQGDRGDTYNFGPLAEDTVVDEPAAVTTAIDLNGPLVAALTVTRTYRWPVGLALDPDQRATQDAEVAVTMRCEVRAGEPFVRLTFAFDNRCRDHRLRLHLPLARRTDRSHAEGQFAVVERGLIAEGGGGEHPIPTFPARGFVDAGGAAVLLDHVVEYELVDEGRTLALTLLRATGWLSRTVHPWRRGAAGPEIPTPQAQCPDMQITRLAVLPHAGDWGEAGVLQAAEKWAHDLYVTGGCGPGTAPLAEGTGLEVTGQGVVLTSLRRRDGALELRVVAETDRPGTARIHGRFIAACRVDLLGRRGEPLPVADSELTVPLLPWEIATIRLAE